MLIVARLQVKKAGDEARDKTSSDVNTLYSYQIITDIIDKNTCNWVMRLVISKL